MEDPLLTKHAQKAQGNLLVCQTNRDHMLHLFDTQNRQGVMDYFDGIENSVKNEDEKERQRLIEVVATRKKYEEEWKVIQSESDKRREEIDEAWKSFDERSNKTHALIEEWEARSKTVREYLTQNGINTRVDQDPDNRMWGVLYDYLTEGNPMPREELLNRLNIYMKGKFNFGVFTDPFMLYVLQKTTESALKEYEAEGCVVILEEALSIPTSILSMKEALDDVSKLQGEEEKLSEGQKKSYDSVLSVLNNKEELDQFNTLVAVAQDIHNVLMSKMGEVNVSGVQ